MSKPVKTKAPTFDQVAAEKFIITWQKSNSPEDVAKALGIDATAARTRASNYRAKGVELKKMSRSQRYDWDALKALAKKK